MKKIAFFSLLALLSITLTNCYKFHVKGPQGQEVQLVAENSGTVKSVKTRTVWYALWGAVPISDNTTEKDLAGMKKASVTTQHTFLDILIGAVTGIITIAPKTVEITEYQ